MQQFFKNVLDNGLTVITVPNNLTNLVCVCVLYKVGSRDENSNKTGIAHLFEHLMFSNCGKNIDFDDLIQNAGGDCNAFTTTDTTQYYNVAPASQINLLLQLEASRMNGFKVTKTDFEVQQKVVIEEFSEHYLNNPYGMFSHQLMPLAYKTHPYQWPVIGKSKEQLSELKLNDIEKFYSEYYCPANAILVISGNFDNNITSHLIKNYFEKIPSGTPNSNNFISEPTQDSKRVLSVSGNYPEEALYIAFHASNRKHKDFYALDFATDILAEGKSSLLYSRLKKENMLFSSIDCYLTSTYDPGLIIIEGKIMKDRKIEEGLFALENILIELKQNPISNNIYQKYLNKNESAFISSQIGVINQALNFSYSEFLGDPNLVNTELENYKSITCSDIQNVFNKYFNFDSANYLIYSN
ncbi:MAG: insulinase family protein [Saprospiraceae bacterium]|nr:insulinase family protein [Saprospiraceae bacterium]